MTKFRLLHIAIFLTLMAAPVLAQTSGQTEQRNTPTRSSSRNLLNLELLTRAEQRADNLRTRILELQTREVELQGRIADLEYQASPAAIQRSLAFVGSVRPMDELRDALRKRFQEEKARVSSQLELLTATRQREEAALSNAEAEIQRLQQVFSGQ
jgi:hypothetical protein